MRICELKELLRAQLRAGSRRDGLGSIMLWGPPGIGKSEVAAQVAAEENAECIDFRLLLCDPTDLRGIPFPDLENNTARWLPPSAFPKDGKSPFKGFLFFDDMLLAPPAVQGAAYQITIPPYRLGEYQLPEGCVVLAATNREGDRSLVRPMPKALANRFIHINLEENLDDWTDWAVKAQINPVVIGFLRSPAADTTQGNLLFQFDVEKTEKAFPTPRTWVKVARILEHRLSPSIEAEVIEGTIGAAAAAQFAAFRRLFDKLPDPAEILKGNYALTPKAMDLKYALAVSIAQRVADKQFDAAIQWAETLEPELGVLLLKILAGKNEVAVMKCPAFIRWMKNNRDLFGR